MLLGCLFAGQNNQLHTLTVSSSGAKGAESGEQRNRASLPLQLHQCRKPRLSAAGTDDV